MRLLIAGLVAAISILTVSVQTASAQTGGTTRPYCLRDGVNGPGMWDCSYMSMEQCLATAHGNGGSCQPNPWYQGPRPRWR
jgi:hypothetical protein